MSQEEEAVSESQHNASPGNEGSEERTKELPTWPIEELRKCVKTLHQETPFTKGVLSANNVERPENFIKGKILVDTIKSCSTKPILNEIGDDDLAYHLGNQLVEHKLIHRVAKVPKKEGSKEKVKYGDRFLLRFVEGSGFHNEDRFIWDEGDVVSKSRNMLILVSTIIVLITMFPIWPHIMRLGIWYLSACLLALILGLIFIRLVVFGVFWMFGVDVWILPNLFDEEASVTESFTPVISFAFSEGGQYLLRIAVLLTVAACAYWTYTRPTEAQLMFDDFLASQRQFVDHIVAARFLSDRPADIDQSSTKDSDRPYASLDEILQEVEEEDEESTTGGDHEGGADFQEYDEDYLEKMAAEHPDEDADDEEIEIPAGQGG